MLADLHTHILPGIDDGAQDLQESLRLLEAEAENGADTLVFTPHFKPQHLKPQTFFENRARAWETLRPHIKEGVSVYLGAEVLYSEYLPNLENIRDFCIGQTDYLLLEMPYRAVFDDKVIGSVERLSGEHGIIPVLAHVERYEAVLRDPHVLSRFREFGCLFQVNADSILQKNFLMKNFLRRLVRIGYLDLVASDCHDPVGRTVSLRAAHEALAERFGPQILRELLATTDHILHDGIPV